MKNVIRFDHTPPEQGYRYTAYEVASGEDLTVFFKKAKNKKKINVPETVKIEEKTYRVIGIAPKAFKAKKIRIVTVGKNVGIIKKNAGMRVKVR